MFNIEIFENYTFAILLKISPRRFMVKWIILYLPTIFLASSLRVRGFIGHKCVRV